MKIAEGCRPANDGLQTVTLSTVSHNILTWRDRHKHVENETPIPYASKLLGRKGRGPYQASIIGRLLNQSDEVCVLAQRGSDGF